MTCSQLLDGFDLLDVNGLGFGFEGAGDLYFLAGELFSPDLVVEPVDIFLCGKNIIATHVAHAVVGTGARGAAHGFVLEHLLVGAGERMDIHRTLTVGQVADKGLDLVSCAGWPGQRQRDDCDSEQIVFHRVTPSNACRPQGMTTNFRCMPSWSSLQITVQITSYSPGSVGAVRRNSWRPGFSSRFLPGTFDRSLICSRVKP